jgi:hypothetical protein
VSEERKIRFKNRELGQFSIDQLYRMAKRGEIDQTAEFWSEKREKWLPLTGITFDVWPRLELESIRSAGFDQVEVLGSGDKNECSACRALHNKTFGINDVPDLPPRDCKCIPWCGCTFIAKE